MIFIAHRGLMNGPDPINENSPMQIHAALMAGFEIEIDVRYVSGRFYLGHDSAQYEIHPSSLYNTLYWTHCKSIETFRMLLINQCVNAFMHDKDDATLTTGGYIWTFPNSNLPLTDKSIAVMPENTNWTKEQLEKCAGICSDYVIDYKKDLGFIPPKENTNG